MRQQYRKEMKRIVVPVLGLAGCHDSIEIKLEADPEQQVITTWQVHTDDQSVLPGVLAKSFVGQSFASPLCPPAVEMKTGQCVTNCTEMK